MYEGYTINHSTTCNNIQSIYSVAFHTLTYTMYTIGKLSYIHTHTHQPIQSHSYIYIYISVYEPTVKDKCSEIETTQSVLKEGTYIEFVNGSPQESHIERQLTCVLQLVKTILVSAFLTQVHISIFLCKATL